MSFISTNHFPCEFHVSILLEATIYVSQVAYSIRGKKKHSCKWTYHFLVANRNEPTIANTPSLDRSWSSPSSPQTYRWVWGFCLLANLNSNKALLLLTAHHYLTDCNPGRKSYIPHSQASLFGITASLAYHKEKLIPL